MNHSPGIRPDSATRISGHPVAPFNPLRNGASRRHRSHQFGDQPSHMVELENAGPSREVANASS